MSRLPLAVCSLARRCGVALAVAALVAAGSTPRTAHAVISLSGGGLVLAEQGGTFAPNNVAGASLGAIPFSSSDLGPQLGIPFHIAANLNDEVYGNSNSWIGGDANPFPAPFAGVALDGSFTLQSIAFGRDNLGGFGDRALGSYTLQYTTAPLVDAGTPDGSWTTIGTLNYVSPGGANFSSPPLRHRFNFDPVANVTGVRLLVPGTGLGGGTAIDEIELYEAAGTVVPPPPNVILTPAPGFGIGFNGNNGVHSTPDNPALAPSNFASASNGAIPFGSSQLGPSLGIPFHLISNINDGEYGNSKSWIADFVVGDPAPFVGVAFDGLINMTSIAWGRDNGNVAGDCCGGTLTDRALGLYRMQYTQVANPDASTPSTGDPTTGWADIGSVDLDQSEPGVFDPHLRHEFRIQQAGGDPIMASGVRLLVENANIAIDEIEVYGSVVPEPSTYALVATALVGLAAIRRRRR